MREVRLQGRKEPTKRWYRERHQELVRELRRGRRQRKSLQRLLENIIRHHPGLAIGVLAHLDTSVIIRAADDPHGKCDTFEIRTELDPHKPKKRNAEDRKCANEQDAHR